MERKKNVSVKFRVFGKKMEIERKVPEKKSKCFQMKIKVKDFAKFGFTSWALCCETWLKFEVETLRCRENLKLKKMFGSWMSP